MAKSTRNSLVLAKVQTTAGTDPVPAAGANAILVRNVNATPLSAEFVERNLIRPYMGNSGQIATTRYGQLEFEVELAGSGEAGTAPAFGPLLRACGFAETTVADTSVTYTPVSTGMELLALRYYLDGLFHNLLDARGTVSFDITAKAIPFMRFRLIGAYQPITDAAMPTGVDYSAFQKPLAANRANTPTWALGAYTGCLQSLTLDIANQLAWRELIGCNGAHISDRRPAGNVLMELPSIAQLNWPQMVLSAQDVPLSITHGVTPGNIVELEMPTAQLMNPSYSDQDGTAMLGLDTAFQPDQGNDEVAITFR
ncbi:hypothetical protein FOZ76_14485 [Verticiella sediminum]|uniref:Uncharacterized protein n=1 Tax=Verticiella sediminum TaxID=1247510 RepID=A0A556AIB0_9BURK|nr:phage tail tube protein [Verticiella sediminum]TSH92626.1 hypothetical protein FOZ76_14485 [Verticiella sediminum]